MRAVTDEARRGSRGKPRRRHRKLAPCPSFPKSRPRAAAWRPTSSGRSIAARRGARAAPALARRAKRCRATLAGQRIEALERRGKYLLFGTNAGTLLVHLGMSGSLRYLREPPAHGLHDHVDVRFADGGVLRFNDPRRFGSWLLTAPGRASAAARSSARSRSARSSRPTTSWSASRGRHVAIKQHLMNGQVVVGVGNIYANEALFRAGIHPPRAAGRIARARFEPLVAAVRAVLSDALEEGGTTLRNYVDGDGNPGYFRQSLNVYERDGEPCKQCGTPIQRRVHGQRATYFCPRCQR